VHAAQAARDPDSELLEITLFCTRAEENSTAIPAPLPHATLFVTVFNLIVGDALKM